MSVISTARNDLHKFVEEVTGRAEKAFAAEKAVIAADVRTALADGKVTLVAAIKAETPAAEAAAVKAVDELVKLADAALTAHGV